MIEAAVLDRLGGWRDNGRSYEGRLRSWSQIPLIDGLQAG
jgi:hypothetical protein